MNGEQTREKEHEFTCACHLGPIILPHLLLPDGIVGALHRVEPFCSDRRNHADRLAHRDDALGEHETFDSVDRVVGLDGSPRVRRMARVKTSPAKKMVNPPFSSPS